MGVTNFTSIIAAMMELLVAVAIINIDRRGTKAEEFTEAANEAEKKVIASCLDYIRTYLYNKYDVDNSEEGMKKYVNAMNDIILMSDFGITNLYEKLVLQKIFD